MKLEETNQLLKVRISKLDLETKEPLFYMLIKNYTQLVDKLLEKENTSTNDTELLINTTSNLILLSQYVLGDEEISQSRAQFDNLLEELATTSETLKGHKEILLRNIAIIIATIAITLMVVMVTLFFAAPAVLASGMTIVGMGIMGAFITFGITIATAIAASITAGVANERTAFADIAYKASRFNYDYVKGKLNNISEETVRSRSSSINSRSSIFKDVPSVENLFDSEGNASTLPTSPNLCPV